MITTKRNIKSGSSYNHYFDLGSVQGNEITLIDNGSVEGTVGKMKMIANRYRNQTQKIAQKLKGASVMDTARNVWNFVYNHIQYKTDNPFREQIRQPLRTWKDRTTGVDCDCYSVFISSILINLGIPHKFRIAAYKDDYQHVYVVVPTGQSEIIIDCVADSFNYEVPASKTKDFTVMSGTSSLNGLGACRTAQPAVVYMSNETISKRGYLWTADVLKQYGIAYTEVINDNGNVPEVHATINGNAMVLPTAITKERAQSIITVQPQNIAARQDSTNGLSGFTPSKILTGVGIGALLYFFFSGNDEKPGTAGLGKTPAKKVALLKI